MAWRQLDCAWRHLVHIEIAGYGPQSFHFDSLILTSVHRNQRLDVAIAERVQKSVLENDRAERTVKVASAVRTERRRGQSMDFGLRELIEKPPVLRRLSGWRPVNFVHKNCHHVTEKVQSTNDCSDSSDRNSCEGVDADGCGTDTRDTPELFAGFDILNHQFLVVCNYEHASELAIVNCQHSEHRALSPSYRNFGN